MEIQMCTEETIDQPLAREATALNAEIAALAKVALRIQAERNEAIRLLKETLLIREAGINGQHKSAIREFLQRIRA
jgi:hypothetical protein